MATFPLVARSPLGGRRICAAALALAVSSSPCAYASGLTGNEIISTIAGTGVLGSSGNGGPATAATLNSYHLQADRSGNLYFVDPSGNAIRRIDAAGTMSLVAGNGTQGYSGDNGPAALAALNQPLGVALDSQGNVYIADRGNNRIRKVSAATGIITTFAGMGGSVGFSGDGGPATQARLGNPYAVTVAADGSVYIADTENRRIRKVDAAGIISTVAGNGVVAATGTAGDGGPALQASFYLPVDVALDAAGNLFVLDAVHKNLRRVDAAGIVHPHAGGGTLTAEGTAGAQFQFVLPGRGIGIDGYGNLFVSENGIDARRVYKIDAAAPHAVTVVAGAGPAGFAGDGGPARAALLQGGNGLEVDMDGNLYIADFTRIRKVSVPQLADVAIVKEAVAASVRTGQDARYLIRVVNNGPGRATNIRVTDIPGAPFSLILPQPGWTCSAVTVVPMTCTLPALAAGASAPPIEVAIATSAEGQMCNTVTAQADQADPAAANNFTAPACVAVARQYALAQFVAFSNDATLLGPGSNVHSGALGANGRRGGSSNQVEIFVQGPAQIAFASFLLGETVRLDNVQVADVRATDPVQLVNGASYAALGAAGSLPILALPALQAANPEAAASGDVTVAENQTLSLPPGRYRNVTLRGYATLVLRGYNPIGQPPGTPRGYDFARLDIGKGAKLLFTEYTGTLNAGFYPLGMTVRVQGTMRDRGFATIGPANPASALKARHLVFHVGGTDAGSTLQTAVPAVLVSSDSEVRANIYAPNGSILFKPGSKGTGAFVGKRVAGNRVDWTLDSAF